MLIIGCDYHPSFQQIAWLDTATGETGEGKLQHPGEAEAFYRGCKAGRCGSGWRPPAACAGSSGCWRSAASSCGWAIRRKIRAADTRKQKTDRRDAELLLELLLDEGKRFPRLGAHAGAARSCGSW